MLIKILALITGFIVMEGVAWFTHKYIMHGFLWILHKSHHRRREGIFELNDLFAIFFAAIAMAFIFSGLPGADWKFFAGIGITAYGAVYFLVHDVYVHRRLKLFPRRSRFRYFEALRIAHNLHHKTHTKHDAESFGFIWVAKKYWEKLPK